MLNQYRSRRGRVKGRGIQKGTSSLLQMIRFREHFPGYAEQRSRTGILRMSGSAASNLPMSQANFSRRSFVRTSSAAVFGFPFARQVVGAPGNAAKGPLMAYVGTYSSPLHDVRPG